MGNLKFKQICTNPWIIGIATSLIGTLIGTLLQMFTAFKPLSLLEKILLQKYETILAFLLFIFVIGIMFGLSAILVPKWYKRKQINYLLKLSKDIYPCFDEEQGFSFYKILMSACSNNDYEVEERSALYSCARRMLLIHQWFHCFSANLRQIISLRDSIEEFISIISNTQTIWKEVEKDIGHFPDSIFKGDYYKLKNKYNIWVENFNTYLRELNDSRQFAPLPDFQ